MPIFDPDPSADVRTIAEIDRTVKATAKAMLYAYNYTRRLIFANPHGLTAEQVFGIFGITTSTGLTVDQLKEQACLLKASINRYAPGTIGDDGVPEATITFPA